MAGAKIRTAAALALGVQRQQALDQIIARRLEREQVTQFLTPLHLRDRRVHVAMRVAFIAGAEGGAALRAAGLRELHERTGANID